MNKKKALQAKNGLILTGGGARAAYQVGVLSAIAKFMPRHYASPFPIISGTSAGAINSTSLACYSSCFHLGVKKLEWVWKNLNTNKIYYSDPVRVFSHLISGVTSSFQADYANRSARSLLNNKPLKDLLNSVFDFERIERNIDQDNLTALAITASSYCSGDSISFYQSKSHISPWNRSKRRGLPKRIDNDILMASSAIPLIFPSKKIQQQHFGDGSIHQLSPLSPAIHLGAEKLFIIGVDQPKEPIHAKENNPHPPTTSAIAGHLLDSIFSDTLQSDLERLERVNATLEKQGTSNKDNELKHIDTFLINPSHDFNAIAVDYYQYLPTSIKLLLRSFGITNSEESSIVSYLLFEKQFCKHLMKLGYEDALNRETEIRNFISL